MKQGPQVWYSLTQRLGLLSPEHAEGVPHRVTGIGIRPPPTSHRTTLQRSITTNRENAPGEETCFNETFPRKRISIGFNRVRDSSPTSCPPLLDPCPEFVTTHRIGGSRDHEIPSHAINKVVDSSPIRKRHEHLVTFMSPQAVRSCTISFVNYPACAIWSQGHDGSRLRGEVLCLGFRQRIVLR